MFDDASYFAAVLAAMILLFLQVRHRSSTGLHRGSMAMYGCSMGLTGGMP